MLFVNGDVPRVINAASVRHNLAAAMTAAYHLDIPCGNQPVNQSIAMKVDEKARSAPKHSLLKHYVPSRSLRSSDSNLLSVARVRTCFGFRSFAVASPTIWNTLPLDIRNSPSMCCFRRRLKTFFYNLVLGHLGPHHIPCASDSAGFSR